MSDRNTELLITSYFNIVKRTMIDMVPKAVMYTLVQYVSYTPIAFQIYLHSLTDSPKTRCSANFSKTCTATTS